MDKKYLEWRRKNVTVRGIKNTEVTLDTPNSDMAGVMGNGLYSAPLSNIRMAKQYGTVYYLVNAIPKNPVVCSSMNEYELFEQDFIKKYCEERGKKYSKSYFESVTSIDKELLKKGFDGVIIKGREMVNYKPKDVRYYQNERQLLQHYEYIEQNLDEKLKKTTFEITKGELEEKVKRDRCLRKADNVYGSKTSAYKSAATVRCRQGKIWKK